MPRKRYVLTGSDCCDRVLPVLGRHAAPHELNASPVGNLCCDTKHPTVHRHRSGKAKSIQAGEPPL